MSMTVSLEAPAMGFEVIGGVAHLTFTDPARGNPIDGRFCRALAETANELSSRNDVRAVLISAEGKSFSYGGDVAMFAGTLDRLPREIKRWTTDLHSAIARLQRMNAPVVAVVHGVCAGGMVAAEPMARHACTPSCAGMAGASADRASRG